MNAYHNIPNSLDTHTSHRRLPAGCWLSNMVATQHRSTWWHPQGISYHHLVSVQVVIDDPGRRHCLILQLPNTISVTPASVLPLQGSPITLLIHPEPVGHIINDWSEEKQYRCNQYRQETITVSSKHIKPIQVTPVKATSIKVKTYR